MLGSAWGEQLLVAAPLAYLCACTYFSLFKLGSLGPYHMVSGATWSWSLLLNASLLARFAAPLCFNYLHVIRMTGGQREGRHMVFVGLMGMEDVPLLGAGFNTWFPLVLVLYVGILVTGWCEDCASKLLTPARLRFDSERADDEHTARGQRLLAAEHEAVAGGGLLGEGTELFGMVARPGRGASFSSGAGGVRPGSSDRELQLGGSSRLRREGSATMRQPLFGARADRSDAPENPGESSVRGNGRGFAGASSGAGLSPGFDDDAERLFANVGRSSRRGGFS